MEEHEVELIDYLRVMWKGKWVILVCFVVALGVAAAVTWTRPGTYSETISYRLRETLSALGITGLDNKRVQSAVEDVDSSFSDTTLSVKGQEKGDTVRVTLSGIGTAESLDNSLDQLTASVREQMAAWARGEVARAVTSLDLSVRQLSRERDLLKQRAIELGSPGPEDPFLQYLAEQVATVEAELVRDQVRLETLRSAKVDDLLTVEEVSRSPVSKIGPSLRLNLAVAGILGLFIGVLLAFFLHYLAEVRKRTQVEKQGPAA